jgi:hypothetical protein
MDDGKVVQNTELQKFRSSEYQLEGKRFVGLVSSLINAF